MTNDKTISAFPRKEYSGLTSSGMTLRDYFAAKAMAAILTNGSWYGHSCRSAADTAYEMADEMLEARVV